MAWLLPHDKELGWTPWAWTVYIVPFALSPMYLQRYANARGWVVIVTTTILFLGLYLRSYWSRGRELYLVAAATLLLGIVFWPTTHAAGAFFIYSAGMLTHVEPSRRAFVIIGSIASLVVVEAWIIERAWYNAI